MSITDLQQAFQLIDANPGAQRKVFDAVLDVSRAIDQKHGTNITQAFWKHIIEGKFDPYD